MAQEKVVRRLVIKAFHIQNAVLGKDNDVTCDGKLTIHDEVLLEILKEEPAVAKIDIAIIQPGDYDRHTNAILDFIPLSTKVSGKLGEGVTHTLTGVYFMLTAIDTTGRQVARSGSPYGLLKDHVCLGKAGTPSAADYIIAFNVTLDGETSHTRNTVTAAHRACDRFCQIFRNKMKKFDGNKCTEQHEFLDKIKEAKFRVAIFKQVPGQGAMFNTHVFSHEPSGNLSGKSVIDMENVPVVLTPNQYRDGALRAM
ncbi:MAG TPA: proline reductase cluster protein PrdD [Selenomonadales bacterium]|nr:proline reductase cluster protein PrdD [Selenomonadales bacterium]